jgi:hypothetical protein
MAPRRVMVIEDSDEDDSSLVTPEREMINPLATTVEMGTTQMMAASSTGRCSA